MTPPKGYYNGDEWKPEGERERDPLEKLYEPARPGHNPSPVPVKERMKAAWLSLEMGMVRHKVGGWYCPEFEITHSGDHDYPLLYIPMAWVRGRQSYRTFQRAVLLAFRRAAK